MRRKIDFNKHQAKRSFCWNLSAAAGLVLFFLFFTTTLSAGPVSRQKAQKLIIGWLKADSKALGTSFGKTIKNTVTFNDENGEPLYYVIYLEPSGFAIVAGDDLAEPIICFAETGEFDASDDNPLGALVKRDLPNRIAAVRKMQKANIQGIKNKDKWDRLSVYAESSAAGVLDVDVLSDVRVESFVLSTWGQTTIGNYIGTPACYNYYTPPGPDGNPDNYPCGCVATAMSQLMRYYEYPAGYTWSNMPLEPDLSMSDTEREAIGDLCYDAAQAIGTVYGSGSSSASLYDADIQLKSSFSYSNSIYGLKPSTGSTLNAIINPNLDAALPVLLGLGKSSGSGGHAIVCDGYGYDATTLYHHLNMGWDGSDNAWYNLPVVNAYYYYNVIDDCVYNIFITGTGEIISGRVTDMAGNPIPDVTVTADAVGTGTYQTTTSAKGIYALTNVVSNKTYTVTAAKVPYLFSNRPAAVGKSSDSASSSGNVWMIDFAAQNETPPIAYSRNIETTPGSIETITLRAADEGLPSPPGDLQYIITQLPTHGRLADPAAGVISTVPYTILGNDNVVEYQSCNYYSGSDNFEFVANDYGLPPTGGDSQAATVTIDVDNSVNVTFAPQNDLIAYWPLYTKYHQARTQVIYLKSYIGTAMRITDLALDIYEAPGQALNNWTIRMKHTSRTSYSSSPYFETTGWTTVYQNNEQPTPIGWRFFHLQTPFEYNGSNNLLIDFSFNNSYGSTDGDCMVSDVFANRVLLSFANGTHGDPLTWSDATAPGIYVAKSVPNIKLKGTIQAEPIAGDFEPDCDVDFVDVAILAKAWRSQLGEPGFNEDCDISPDNVIDEKDLEQLIMNWLTDAF